MEDNTVVNNRHCTSEPKPAENKTCQIKTCPHEPPEVDNQNKDQNFQGMPLESRLGDNSSQAAIRHKRQFVQNSKKRQIVPNVKSENSSHIV